MLFRTVVEEKAEQCRLENHRRSKISVWGAHFTKFKTDMLSHDTRVYSVILYHIMIHDGDGLCWIWTTISHCCFFLALLVLAFAGGGNHPHNFSAGRLVWLSKPSSHGQKSRFFGDGKNPTFNDGILISWGPYKPLRTWVDEFPIPYYMEIMGV